MARARWSSRGIFLLAAVGSAVGLGNVWRFPYLAYKHGGGAFLIPYLIALFLIGIPLLMLEFAVGQKLQRGAVECYRTMHRRFAGLGWFALATAFLVASYYGVIMAWALLYLIASPTVAWSADPGGYFYHQVLNLIEKKGWTGELGGFNPTVLVALAAVWVMVYFCVWRGVKSVGAIVLITVPLPLLLLAVLLVRAVTLDGFADGWAYYLQPDFKVLRDGEVWLAAASQIFFTLTLGFGVMVAYASHKDRDADVAKDSFTTALVNSATSLFAGFVVFGVIGYMASVTGKSVDDAANAGPDLAFVVFPQALSLMPWPGFFSVLFFLTLMTLGIDSAFSLTEGINVAIKDLRNRWSLPKIALVVCGMEFLVGVIFCTRAGIYLLDIVDHFVTHFNLVLVGVLEALLVGWYFGAEKLRSFINEVSDFKMGKWLSFAILLVVPLALSILVVTQLVKEFVEPYEKYPPAALAVGWIAVLGPLLLLVVGLLKGRPSNAEQARQE